MLYRGSMGSDLLVKVISWVVFICCDFSVFGSYLLLKDEYFG